MASTINGEFLVGSKDGQIRLYDKVGANAKTLLPGIGAPVTGVDVSQDGTWIVATTNRDILVIPTLCPNGKTGFSTRMGKNKPRPRRLNIRNTDLVKYGLTQAVFTKATFDNGDARHDTHIVSSLGSYIITWRMKDIKRGRLGEYEIKREEDSIVSSMFRYNGAQDVIVTLPRGLAVERRKRR